MRHIAAATVIFALSACNSQPQPNLSGNGVSPVGSPPGQVDSPTSGPVNVTDAPNAPGQANDAATSPSSATRGAEESPPPSLAEPKGAIDPKGVEAAGQVVQHYGALIEQKRWEEAAKLWGNRDAAAAFAAKLLENRETHLEIGELGRPEGAAGSIYVSMPVTLYGDDAGGQQFRAHGTVVLRRVNDVPGSTEAQRRWHIQRVEWRTSS